MISDPVAVALRVSEVLEACGVRYLVGGSLASSIAGEPRSTLDVDLVVELDESQIPDLLLGLGDEFHADAEDIRRAVRNRSSANVIHLKTAIKVDLFVLGGTPLDATQMRRRRRVAVSDDPERFLFVYTPEDILLQKLRWYRLGREVSDRQWRDVMGLLLVSGAAMDEAYLRDGARTLGVTDLLDRAFGEWKER